MSKAALAFLATAILLTGAAAAPQVEGANKGIPKKQVMVDGHRIRPESVLAQGGKTYISLDGLAEALGTKIVADGPVLSLDLPPRSRGCAEAAAPHLQLSEQFRQTAVHIPDQIESLRAAVSSRANRALHAGPSFGTKSEEIDQRLSGARANAATAADYAVYYALAHANNALGIWYYQVYRDALNSEGQNQGMDSMVCSMESKFALLKGKLIGAEECSVLQRYEAQPAAVIPEEKK